MPRVKYSASSVIGKWLLTALVFFCGTTVVAQSVVPVATTPVDEEWKFSLAPYLFLPFATKGTSEVAGTSADLDLDLSDILDLLDVAFSARFEARRGRFGVVTDLYYVDLGLTKGATLEPQQNPNLGLTATLNVDVDVKQGWGNVMGMYRVYESAVTSERPVSLDLGLGARWNYLKQEIHTDLKISGIGSLQQGLGGSESWWEPVVGARAIKKLSHCLSMAVRLEAGGFGAGGDDLQWSLLAGVERSFGPKYAMRFGYQYYKIDYSTLKSDGRFSYDIYQHGPHMAFVWRW